MLKTITGDRIWYELECVFGEELPEKVFARAGKLGILAYLDPALKADGWLASWFDQARRLSLPGKPSAGLYLAMLTYRLDEASIERLIDYLKLDKGLSRILRDSQKIRALHGRTSQRNRYSRAPSICICTASRKKPLKPISSPANRKRSDAISGITWMSYVMSRHRSMATT